MHKELIYAFIEDYLCLKKVEFNFSPYFNIHYDYNKKELSIESTHFPKAFFPAGVSSVSVIVGENGAGKSTALKWIAERIISGYAVMKLGGIIVMRDDEGLKLYYDVEIAKILKENNGLTIYEENFAEVEGKKINSKLSLPLIYDCGHFDILRSEISTDNGLAGCENISDKYLLIHDLENYRGDDPIRKDFSMHQIMNAYVNENDMRICRLLLNPNFRTIDNDNVTGQVDIRLPKYIWFSSNNSAHYNIENMYQSISSDKRQTEDNSNLETKYWIELKNFAHNTWIKDHETKQGKALLADILHDSIRSFFYNFGKIDLIPINKRFELLSLVKEEYQSSDSPAIKCVQDIKYRIERAYCGECQTKDSITGTFEYMYTDFFDKLLKVLNKLSTELKWKNGTVVIGTNNLESFNYGAIEPLIKDNLFLTERFFDLHYSHLPPALDYIPSALSSGEMGMLNLFSRLLSAFIQSGIPSLIILDEVETSFHPEWQRRFLNRLLSFLPYLLSKEDSVQIIYTTHSPITLSDLPKGCVNMIKCSGDTSLDVPLKEKMETFGANVFELYGDSFFMEKGLIGEFAVSKIKALAKRIEVYNSLYTTTRVSYDKDEYNELRNRIEIIGDDRIKAYLLSRLDITKDRDKDKEIEKLRNEINELKQRIKNEKD